MATLIPRTLGSPKLKLQQMKRHTHGAEAEIKPSRIISFPYCWCIHWPLFGSWTWQKDTSCQTFRKENYNIRHRHQADAWISKFVEIHYNFLRDPRSMYLQMGITAQKVAKSGPIFQMARIQV